MDGSLDREAQTRPGLRQTLAGSSGRSLQLESSWPYLVPRAIAQTEGLWSSKDFDDLKDTTFRCGSKGPRELSKHRVHRAGVPGACDPEAVAQLCPHLRGQWRRPPASQRHTGLSGWPRGCLPCKVIREEAGQVRAVEQDPRLYRALSTRGKTWGRWKEGADLSLGGEAGVGWL